MKIQIIVEDNIIIIGNKSKDVDCSQFDFRFCEINDIERWVERIPFTGREDLEDWDEVEDFIVLHSVEEPIIIEEETPEQIILNYKSYYLEVWNTKLKELDYDGIETVIFWKTTATDQTFKTEATRLASWYEAMITFNYTTLNAVNAGTMEQPTKEEYLSLLPKFEDII